MIPHRKFELRIPHFCCDPQEAANKVTPCLVVCLKSCCKTRKQIFPFPAGIPHFCTFQIIHSNSLQPVGLRNNSAIPDSLTTYQISIVIYPKTLIQYPKPKLINNVNKYKGKSWQFPCVHFMFLQYSNVWITCSHLAWNGFSSWD